MATIPEDDDGEYDSDDNEKREIETDMMEVKAPEIAKLAPPKYEIRPNLYERFQSLTVREIISQSMLEQLHGSAYSEKNAEKWVKSIAARIRERVNLLDMKRYKVIVQVFLGENNGAGVKSCLRTLWDSESDNYITEQFVNDEIFCFAAVFGLYFY